MLLRSLLAAAALAAFAAPPASAQSSLADLKPCYIAAQEDETEPVLVNGWSFTPAKAVQIYVDEVEAEQATVDLDGRVFGTVDAPFIDAGERPFSVRVSEVSDIGVVNSVTKTARVTRLEVTQTPSRAATRERVRFRGRGFTETVRPDDATSPFRSVYAHYVFAGKAQKTVRLGRPTGSCGRFSVKRKQFPFKNSPRRGVWTIQFDQQRTYDPKAAVRYSLTVRVRKAVKPQRARAR
jgi:hypothetical protein